MVPFPKKDKGVVRLPNVNAYPDFLTGVQDLQAAMKRGDFSDETYKKLYQDLIHRFMRVESFETPWFIREDKEQQLDQKLDKLVDIAKKDSKAQNIVGAFLDKIINYGKNLLGNKQKSSVQEQPFQGIQTLDQKLANAHLVIDQLKKVFGLESNPIFDKILQATDKLSIQPDIEKLLKGIKQKEFEKGQVAQQTQSLQIKQEIQKLISKLVAKFSPTESQDETRLEQIRSFFTAAKISDQDTKKFLQLAIEGKVINMNNLVNAGSGKISDHVNPSARSVYDKIYKNFMFLQPARATGRGNLGSGEIFFVLLGSPAEKSGKGDLTVTIDNKERKLEVKASRKTSKGKKSGGRLDGGAPAAKDTKNQWNSLLKKYFGISNFDQVDYNITEKTLTFINEIIKKRKIARDIIVKFTKDMLNLFSNQPLNYEKLADMMVNDDGTLDASFTRTKNKDNKFMRGIALANYASYQQAHKFDSLMMVNIDSQDYEMIDSYENFKKSLADGDTEVTGNITFSDPSNKTALQIYTSSKTTR